MQIAEKYRKELRELNEGPLHLPKHSQGDSKEDNPTARPDTLQLKETWEDEVEVVKDANGVRNDLEKDEESTVIAEISEGERFVFFTCSGISIVYNDSTITAIKIAVSQS